MPALTAPTTPIAYLTAPCPLGWLLVARTARGICAIRLGDSQDELENTFRREYPAAERSGRNDLLQTWCGHLLRYLRGTETRLDLPLDVAGTPFQQRVWLEMRNIPYGSTRSYRELARAIGRPAAIRAAAHACATNPVSLIIPCHRVVRSDGSLGGYFWGLNRKKSLLAMEAGNAPGARPARTSQAIVRKNHVPEPPLALCKA